MPWRYEVRKVADLKEYERNPRTHTDKGLADLEASIDEFGVVVPLIIQPDGTICGGHGRKGVMLKRGIEEAPCMVPDRPLTNEEFRRLNLRLNKNVAGVWNLEMLSTEFPLEMLHGIGFTDFDLKLDSGFRPDMQPGIGTGNVTGDDMARAQDKLGGMGRQQNLKEAMCPDCGKVFYVD